MKCTEDPIENDPDKCYENSSVIIRNLNFSAAGFYIVFGKLLLTSGAFIFGREESEDHLDCKYSPCYGNDSGDLFKLCSYFVAAYDPESDISDQK